MLSDAEAQLVGDAYLLRASEQESGLWFCPGDALFVEAARLHERRYLDRRWHGDDVVFRLSDEAMTAQALHQLIDGQSPN